MGGGKIRDRWESEWYNIVNEQIWWVYEMLLWKDI